MCKHCPGCQARTLARESGSKLLSSPEDVAAHVRSLIGEGAEQEHFVVIALNVRNGMVGAEVVAKGTAYSVEVSPRDVFRYAVRTNAAGIVIAHNHPSGDPTPSEDDIALTKRLIAVGETLGIPVVDHVVVCDTRFYSMSEQGVLK
jgi:DNA repair protein RadC